MLITGREAGVGGYVIWIILGTQLIYNVMRIAFIKFKPLTGVVEGVVCIRCGEEEFLETGGRQPWRKLIPDATDTEIRRYG